MSNPQYVSLVPSGGVPVRLAQQNGAPYPTTGTGSLVFSNGPVLTNAVLNGFTLNAPIIANSNGTQAQPAFAILTSDKGLYSNGTGNISFAASNVTLASFTTTGGGIFIDYFLGNGTRLTTLSDTSNEVQMDAVDTTGVSKYNLSLNKYGGNVFIGNGLSAASSSNGNLTVKGNVSASNLSLAKGTLVASVPTLITETWSNSGVNFEAFKINVTATNQADPSYIMRLQIGGADRFSVDRFGTGIFNAGVFMGGSLQANTGSAPPAGGSQGVGLLCTTTAHYGVFFGVGVPTLSAAKGSLYLRSDGTTTNDRAYINTDGATTWTALTTAA